MKKAIQPYLLGIFILMFMSANAQVTKTAEDSLNSVSKFLSGTTIGGYGDVLYQNNTTEQTAKVDMERIVLFVGHKFSSKFSYFSELEVENAKVSGGENGGEVAFEQSYIKFNLDSRKYFVAGLFLPRMGILNENHLPTTFNGNERTQVETYILPSTWRELGIGFYGNVGTTPLNYSIGLVNGLDAASFVHGSGIREGRYEGRNASANSLAFTGSIQYVYNDLKVQLCGYYGGTNSLSKKSNDSLNIATGIFSLPVGIAEADVQYIHSGFSLRLLASYISIAKANDINRLYLNNTPNSEYGYYAEVGYNLFEKIRSLKKRQLVIFCRYEKLDMNYTIPSNAITDGTLAQSHLIAGLGYWPIKNIVIKADYRFMHTVDANPLLMSNASMYNNNTSFINLGLGFSF